MEYRTRQAALKWSWVEDVKLDKARLRMLEEEWVKQEYGITVGNEEAWDEWEGCLYSRRTLQEEIDDKNEEKYECISDTFGIYYEYSRETMDYDSDDYWPQYHNDNSDDSDYPTDGWRW
jgi:hypothetical protein